jgi:hypothetical protein
MPDTLGNTTANGGLMSPTISMPNNPVKVVFSGTKLPGNGFAD